MSPTDPLVEHASKIDSRVRSLSIDPFGSLPQFTYEFASKVFPELSGAVTLSYPSMGEMLEIERLVVRGRPYSEVMATLQVLTDKAPASWYRISPGDTTPSLALGRLPYDPEFFEIYARFAEWRDSFRSGAVALAAGESK